MNPAIWFGLLDRFEAQTERRKKFSLHDFLYFFLMIKLVSIKIGQKDAEKV